MVPSTAGLTALPFMTRALSERDATLEIPMKTRQTGFTLIEIAIVLVIIGLLLGGVLKGQELITGARVRNLISQQDGVKAAYFGFLDRFRALPGDYSNAVATITNITTPGACGGTGASAPGSTGG